MGGIRLFNNYEASIRNQLNDALELISPNSHNTTMVPAEEQ